MPRKSQPQMQRLATDFLVGSPQSRHILTGSRSELKSSFGSPVGAVLPEKRPRPKAPTLYKEERPKLGVSINELVQTAEEKYELNKNFWGKYTDIPSMAQASEKEDILLIVDNFVLIRRKHVYLFQRLKTTILRNLDSWSAPDFAALCHAWAQLGFLHEDLCVAMADRVTATAHICNTQELCWLMDAYATTRCVVDSVVEEITNRTLLLFDDFTLSQLCLHASSFARLNIRHGYLLDSIASRLASAPGVVEGEVPPCFEEPSGSTAQQPLSARDLTLAAYSFAKLGYHQPRIFEVIARRALDVIRDFTARDLQMVMVAFARARQWDAELLAAISLQAQRRIAQFSSESLVLTLRAVAFFEMRDSPLFTRTIAQLPRAILTFRPVDLTILLNAFAAVQVHSLALFDVVTPFILEKAPMFTPADWLSALRGYSSLGHRDAMFLSALGLHLEASKLTLQQLCMAMVDCSRLSFSGTSASLVEAASTALEGADCSADAAAQMYSALLLLGHSGAESGSDAIDSFLGNLSSQLRDRETLDALSPASCVNLCYATLLAPPVRTEGDPGGSRHPVDALPLAERCIREARRQALSGEALWLLRPILRALELLPWNREGLLPAGPAARAPFDPPAPFLAAALWHLAPHVAAVETAPLQAALVHDRLPQEAAALDTPASDSFHSDAHGGRGGSAGCGATKISVKGIFVAREIHDSLTEVSAALSARGVEHRMVQDDETEVHIVVNRQVLLDATGVPTMQSGSRELAIMWGSTVHYTAPDAEVRAELPPRLSPTAQLQVALLRASWDVEVLLVPYWWWPRNSHPTERGRALVNFLLAELAKLPPVEARGELAKARTAVAASSEAWAP